jgi:hypothetical protein
MCEPDVVAARPAELARLGDGCWGEQRVTIGMTNYRAWIFPMMLLSTGAVGATLKPARVHEAPVVHHGELDGPVVPNWLWRSLAAPDSETLQWLSKRIPELDTSVVRTLTTKALDLLLTEAIARGQSPLDFFTDSGFLGHRNYYLSQATLVSIFARYEIRVLTAVSGTDVDNRSFNMVALVLGSGRIETLYDRDAITFVHPGFDNKRFTLAARVTQTILGPGDLSTSGITAHVSFLRPTIQRMTKVSATEARIKTNLGSRTKPVTPIRRKVFVAVGEG